MPSETQVMRCVVRWNGRDPEHSSIGPVVRANPGVDTGVQFAFTESMMALYYEDPSSPNGFAPAAGTPQYASTSKFPEGAVVELRADGNRYTARVNGRIVLQGTVEADRIPFTNRYVGTVIQDDSRERGGGQPPRSARRLPGVDSLTGPVEQRPGGSGDPLTTSGRVRQDTSSGGENRRHATDPVAVG